MILLTVSYGNPWAWFLLIIPIIMFVYNCLMKGRTRVQLHVSSFFDFKSKSWKVILQKLMPYASMLAAVLIVVAIARPQGSYTKEKSYTKGIDIVMAIDVSTSMLEKDFSPNRLEAAKSVASEFVSKRPNDRIGVVVFSGESFTQCPPTIDHNIVQKQIGVIQDGLMEDGTAIGMGLATSVRVLKNSNAKSKVCILLTDGVNTAGKIDPMTAVEIARNFNVKVYTIGVGTPRGNILGIDETLMNAISKSTGGIYFRAGSTARLKEIYDQINRLETIEIEKNAMHKKTELYLPWLLAAFIILVLQFVLKYTLLKGII
ncbi:MAG: vWA domain-containing protein [Chitinophagales bacterium]|jgi:Ca-activated chloride channel family protein|nr:VWA domain-containing protein [Sphingobacteriales bacterium]